MDNSFGMHVGWQPAIDTTRPSMVFDEYRVERILSQRKSHFIEDFTYADICRDLKNARILSDDELTAIRTMKIERERIEYLFFLLVYADNGAAFNAFLNVLQDKYEWLAEQIRSDWMRSLGRSHEMLTDDVVDYREAISRLRKEIPKHIDFNVHRCKFLWSVRQKLLMLERHQTLVVLGSLSFGKQWIVMDACCSYEVMHKMGGKIFWINCSKCKTPEKILQTLERLAVLTNQMDYTDVTMTNYKDIQNKIVMLTENLRRVFDKQSTLQNSLIVLVDVQSHDTIKAFDLHCKVLITTRNKRLLENLSRTNMYVEVNTGFTRHECLQLFSKMLDVPISELPAEASDLHHICRKNPFIISRVASNLKEISVSGRWVEWKARLQNNESMKFDEFRKPIEQSLKAISDISDLYRELVIFTDNVDIPICVLQRYWGRSKSDVEAIIERLDKLYLLERVISDNQIYCSLHYHYYSYLTNLISAKDKEKMHAKLVDSYRIPEALERRTELNITDLADDKYFHFYIGYHLRESKRTSLFPDLYLDFGFIEQKLRYTGLPNTLGDFSTYKTEIVASKPDRIELLDDLTDFLANIEEILRGTPDACLLQYALNTDSAIRTEAIHQARKFPDRIWFTDIDHSVKYRQIVQLPERPILIRFIEPNSSLIAFADNRILLIDMSFEYTVEPTVYKGHDCAIRDLKLLHKNYFVSLDEKGIVKVWSLKDTEFQRRRQTNGDIRTHVGVRQKFPSTSACERKTIPGQLLQTMDVNVCCLTVNHHNDLDNLHMFAGTTSGRVLFYQWNDTQSSFEIRPSLSFDTHIENIDRLIMIPNLSIMMIINRNGASEFIHLTDNSKASRTSRLAFPPKAPVQVHELSSHSIAVVYFDCVYYLTIRHVGQILLTDMIEAYRTTNEQNFITCSTITEDSRYLMLGTRKGIIVFDPLLKREVLRSSVNDNITSIDVCSLDDDVNPYVLISSTKKGGSVINVHGVRVENGVIEWATNRFNANIGARGMRIAWLSGGKAFDVRKDDDNTYSLCAADSNCSLHCIRSSDSFNASVDLCRAENVITAVSIGANGKYYGCANGTIHEFMKHSPQAQLNESIEYLKYYEQFDVLIAGTRNSSKIFAHQLSLDGSGPVLITFPFRNRFIVLIHVDCSFEILDLSSKQMHRIKAEENGLYASCATNIDDRIVLSVGRVINIFKVEDVDAESIQISRITGNYCICQDEIKSLAATTNDGKLLTAVGYRSGIVELFETTTDSFNMTQRLKCHKEAVNCLMFSPVEHERDRMNNLRERPIILISISEEICFWNVTHALNNPIDRGNELRLSQRINRRSVSNKSNVSPSQTNGNATDSSRLYVGRRLSDALANDNNELCTVDPWAGKTGASAKPELLSCIKFVGSSAEKLYANEEFDTFITIDNEGVIYFLRINNQSNGI